VQQAKLQTTTTSTPASNIPAHPLDFVANAVIEDNMARQKESGRTKLIREGLHKAFPGSRWVKIHGDHFQESGIADLIGCVAGRYVAIEMKTSAGQWDPLQKIFCEEVEKAGGIYILWTIDDSVTTKTNVDRLEMAVRRALAEKYLNEAANPHLLQMQIDIANGVTGGPKWQR
jgi:hypothetical protein